MAQTSSSYSLLPINIVIELISSLEDLQLSLFFKTAQLQLNGPTDTTLSLCTIFRHNDNWMRYIIAVTNEVTSLSSMTPSVQFIAVNYGADGTLLQSYLMSNVVQVPVTVIRSEIQVYWRSQFFSMNFSIPQLDRLREIKQSLTNVFVYPTLTYVLFGKLVFNFSFIEQFYAVTYIGEMEYQKLKVLPLTYFDWLDGILCGKIDSQLFFCWSNLFFAITNQFPDIYYLGTSSKLKVLIGGYDNYMITNRTVQTDSILIKATYAHKLSVQSNEILGSIVSYTTLKEFIPITGTPLFILSFSNVILKGYQTKYAVIGTTTFTDTNFPIETFPATVVFTQTKDPSFNSFGTVFVIYYKYDAATKTLLVYEPGFMDYLMYQNGNVILSDLIPYSLDEKYKFNPVANDTTEFINRPNRKLLTKPTNNSYVPSFANAMMRMKSPHAAKKGLTVEEAAAFGCHPREAEAAAAAAFGYRPREAEAAAAFGCYPREAEAAAAFGYRPMGTKPPFTSASASTLGIQRKQKLVEQGIETTK